MPKNKRRAAPAPAPVIEEWTAEQLNEIDDPSWFELVGQWICDLELEIEFEMMNQDRIYGSSSEVIAQLKELHDANKKKAKKLRALGLN